MWLQLTYCPVEKLSEHTEIDSTDCHLQYSLYSFSSRKTQALVTVLIVSGSCGFLMDYNLFLSEPRWGLCISRLRPIDNPITAPFELTWVTIHSNKQFPLIFYEGIQYFPMNLCFGTIFLLLNFHWIHIGLIPAREPGSWDTNHCYHSQLTFPVQSNTQRYRFTWHFREYILPINYSRYHCVGLSWMPGIQQSYYLLIYKLRFSNH